MCVSLADEIGKDSFRERLAKYTVRAFNALPKIDNPCILDIGCGSGVPTMTLAKLSGGKITGIDVDNDLIAKLALKIEKAGFGDRVTATTGSMAELDMPNKNFDIIWSEGSIFAIGFKKGLREWKRLLKKRGFLIIHDAIGDRKKKLKYISEAGYTLLDSFTLPGDTWWSEYYSPLEARIQELRNKYRQYPSIQKALSQEQKEIDMCRKNPRQCCSIYFILQSA